MALDKEIEKIIEDIENKAELENQKSEAACLHSMQDHYYLQGKASGLTLAAALLRKVCQ